MGGKVKMSISFKLNFEFQMKDYCISDELQQENHRKYAIKAPQTMPCSFLVNCTLQSSDLGEQFLKFVIVENDTFLVSLSIYLIEFLKDFILHVSDCRGQLLPATI